MSKYGFQNQNFVIYYESKEKDKFIIEDEESYVKCLNIAINESMKNLGNIVMRLILQSNDNRNSSFYINKYFRKTKK